MSDNKTVQMLQRYKGMGVEGAMSTFSDKQIHGTHHQAHVSSEGPTTFYTRKGAVPGEIGWDNKANEVAWCNSKGGETVRRSANAEKRFHRIDGVATRETTNAIRHQFMKLPGSPLPSPTGSPVSRGSFGAGSPFSNPCSSLGSRSPSRTSQVSQ